jgi:hypothetical protein
VHNNLFTNIDAGLAMRIFASGGEKSRGANSGEQGCAARQAAISLGSIEGHSLPR